MLALLLALLAPSQAAPLQLCFDDAHHNVHSAAHGYAPFADLARQEGFRIETVAEPWNAATLARCDLLVVVSPRGAGREATLRERAAPAFTEPEVAALAEWLGAGHGLLLITDHAPIGAATRPLAARLGIDMSNGFVEDAEHAAAGGMLVFSRQNGLLNSHPITDGRGKAYRVDRIAGFLGQSLAGPPGSVSLLTFGSGARDRYRASTDRLWLDPSPQDLLRPAGGRSQAIAFAFGGGRVVALGDAAMLTSLGPGSESGLDLAGFDNARFAANILRWLARRL
ncbi:MAG: hypothetical protein ACM3OB_08855 [Acidobacteriota bacterium]